MSESINVAAEMKHKGWSTPLPNA